MPDDSRLPWLARLLPREAVRDLFEPAWHDLVNDRLARVQHAPSPFGRRRAQLRYAGAVVVLMLDCWRLTLAGMAVAPPPTPQRPKPREHSVTFLNDIRHAVRRLLRERAFTAAAVATLALGVGANVAVFAAVEAVLLRPLPYADAGRLAIVRHRDTSTGITKDFVAVGDFVDLRHQQSAFGAFASYSFGQATLHGDGDPLVVPSLQAGPGFQDVFRIRPWLGRAIATSDSRPGAGLVVMLGYDLWRTRYGSDSSIVGRSLPIGNADWEVVGIAPPGFHFPMNSATDVIIPLRLPAEAPAQRKSGWTFVVGRLKPGVTMEQATGDLAAVSRRMAEAFPGSNTGSTYFALSLRDATVGSTKVALLLMLAAVGAVLLIACANVSNLMLARAVGRQREMALRMALGAGRARLAQLLLAESLVLSAVASVAAVVVARWGVRALVGLVPKSMAVAGLADARVNGIVLAFAAAVTLVAATGFALVSALSIDRGAATNLQLTTNKASAGQAARRTTSRVVLAEVALAVVLLIAAGLTMRSFAGLMSADPGFRYDHVMTLSMVLPAARYPDSVSREAFYDRAFASLKAVPGVVDVGAAAVTPLTGNNWTVGFERSDKPLPDGERPPEVGWQVASGGFFTALRIPLRQGRLFDRRDVPGGKPVVIVSEGIARQFFRGEPAVGRLVKTGDGDAEIVGVVGDIRRAGLRDAPRADMYFPFARHPDRQTTLFVRTQGDPAASLASLERVLREIEPGTAFLDSGTLDGAASDSVRDTRLLLWLLGVFAATALVLAAVGIYGVMSYSVRQRSREIGIRIALGANRREVLWLVVREGGTVALIGIVIGVAVSLGAARALGSVLYGVSAHDPLTLAVSALALGATSVLACLLPAWRAASLDPARALGES